MKIQTIIRNLLKPAGRTTIFSFNPKTGEISSMIHQDNMIMSGAALCVGNLLLGLSQFKVGAMYFEFVNLASPGDDPNPPGFVSTDDVSYFVGLQYSYDRDFLRVPVVPACQVTDDGSGNYLATFYAVTPGSDQGFWGKPFDPANNSAVYGGALVATPVAGQQSSDVVIARNYPVGAKVLKPTGEQICMVWTIQVMKP